MILIEPESKIYESKLFIIMKFLKSWQHDRKIGKFDVLVLINYQNLRQLIVKKNLTLTEIKYTQKIS